MDSELKLAIGHRLRKKREAAGYSREKLGELCSLSPRFIANIEFGTSTFSLDSLMTVCRVLSCSSDSLLFGESVSPDGWDDLTEKLTHVDLGYHNSVDKLLQGLFEVIAKAEKK